MQWRDIPHLSGFLLVEDDPDDAWRIVRTLQRSWYEVTWERVQTAPALEAALQQQWDLITCDWVMPEFSAPAALKLLEAHGVELPVIIVSGQAAEELAVAARQAGAHDVVSKHSLTRLGPAVARGLHEADVRWMHSLVGAAGDTFEVRFGATVRNGQG